MEATDCIKAKIAKALLNQRDSSKRKRQLMVYIGVLLALFMAHAYFANLTSPLKLIPQTMSAIGMGYLILTILTLRQFSHIADFIDWDKVNKSAESDHRD